MSLKFIYGRSMSHSLLRICKRFISEQTIPKTKSKWIAPIGYNTHITVYNPVTKCKVPLILRNRNFLTWYMCGPTVYDSAHIGHAATYVRLDIIRRILMDYFNINVILLMGITDIDDKLIKRSKETKQNFKEIAKYYEYEFFDDMRKLNVLQPYLSCRVTEYVKEIIDFVTSLIDKGYGYVANDGSVYFNLAKYDGYGKLGNKMLETNHEDKASTLDFALWKAAKEDEPSWPSPWGKGRPGWHTECSTFASAIFGDKIDVHSGGIDLAFPHHENEEAQSCCYHNIPQWVNYWVHCGHLHLSGDEKMSKSLKNVINIQDYLNKYTANQFRMLCLLSHYKNGIEFSDHIMEQPISILNKIENFISDCNNYIIGNFDGGNINEAVLLRNLDEVRIKVHTNLADDFNTAQAIHAILSLVHVGNKMLYEKVDTSKRKGVAAIAAVSNYVSSILLKFGIIKDKTVERDNKIDDIIENFVQFRSAVRSYGLCKRDETLLAACDEARQKLSTYGIIMKDTRSTTTWHTKKL